jgi:hypothetical protein
MGIVAVVLGLIGMRSAAADMFRFVNPPSRPNFWVSVHLEKFLGSYIAAWTAFSAVTLSQVFPSANLAVWLRPAAAGIPAIMATAMYYRRKFAGRVPEGASLQAVTS